MRRYVKHLFLLACWSSACGAQGCYSPNWKDSPNDPGSSGVGGVMQAPPPEEPALGAQPERPEPVVESEEAAAGAGGAAVSDGAALGEVSPPAPVFLPGPVPAPCADIAYSAQLPAPAGDSWRLLSTPPGLTFDIQTGLIGGTPRAGEGGPLELELLTPSGSRRALVSVDLSLRHSCWLAYLSAASPEPARLHLRDVFLTHDVVLPAQDSTAAVADFKFSPDGAWLAFRAGTPEQYDLYLYSSRVLPPVLPLESDVVPIDFGCTTSGPARACGVLDYAWSEDSQHLAVVLSGASAEQDYLSGVDIAAEAPARPWPLVGEAAWVASTIPLDYHGQLVWVGSTWLGFLGVNFGSTEPLLPDALYSASLVPGADGSLLDGLRGSTSILPTPASRLLGTATGLALVYNSAFDDRTVVFQRRSTIPEDERLAFHSGWLSPSGRWVAQTDMDSRLRIYDVANELEPVAQTDIDACTELVAWSDRVEANALERIACRYGQSIRVFDYFAEPLRLEPLQGKEIAFSASLTGTRRAFSGSGHMLVLGDAVGAEFSLVDVSEATPVTLLPPSHFDAPAELHLAPGRDVVAIANASAANEYALPGSERSTGYLTPALAPRSTCTERFWEGPESWCGAPRIPGHLAYSPDSNSLMFESAVGVLVLGQPGVDSLPRGLTSTLPPCDVNCQTRLYAFKP